MCWSHEWLEIYSEHLIGVTLHDLQDLAPHHPPGTGDIEWDTVFTQIPSDIVKVFELQHCDTELVIQGREMCET